MWLCLPYSFRPLPRHIPKIVGHKQQSAVDKDVKWKYQRLAESRPMQQMCRRIVKQFTGIFQTLYEFHKQETVFEWLILVDNSGSMGLKELQVTESLVLMMEVLRKLECRFGVIRFGNRTGQYEAKPLDAPFDFLMGQKVLESFSYDEGTYPIEAIKAAVAQAWPSTDTTSGAHRMMVMITDGLTAQNDIQAYLDSLKGILFSVLLINDKRTGDYIQDIQNLLQGICYTPKGYEIVEQSSLNNLPVHLMQVLINLLGYVVHSMREKSLAGAAAAEEAAPPLSCAAPTLPQQLPAPEMSKMLSDPMTVEKAAAQGHGAPSLLYNYSPADAALPCARPQAKPEPRPLPEDLLPSVHRYYQQLGGGGGLPEALQEAAMDWAACCAKLAPTIDAMADALRDTLFCVNRYTRRCPHFEGGSLHVPGLIKAVASDWTYKKFFAVKAAGGRHHYSVALVLDVSTSMRGHLHQCLMETLVALVAALQELGVESLSIVAFGSRVTVLKTEEQDWGPAVIYTLMQHLAACAGHSTRDADAVEVALHLLRGSRGRGAKKMLVLTDGYGSTGSLLADAQQLAEEAGVEVLGLGVGFDATFVDACYRHWVTAALPVAVPDAIRARHDHGGGGPVERRDWSALLRAEAGAALDRADMGRVLLSDDRAFPQLVADLTEEREVSLTTDPAAAFVTVDVCVCIDCTGSMRPWLQATREHLKGIVRGLGPSVAKQFPGLPLAFRFAAVAYTDYGGGGGTQRGDHVRTLDFRAVHDTRDAEAAQHNLRGLVEFLEQQKAEGGGDRPEDVLGALDSAAGLTWQSKIRLLLLITDAPGHGRDLNDDPSDRCRLGAPALLGRGRRDLGGA